VVARAGGGHLRLTGADLSEIQAAADQVEIQGARYSEAARRMIDR
jgi:hypothetical protein